MKCLVLYFMWSRHYCTCIIERSTKSVENQIVTTAIADVEENVDDVEPDDCNVTSVNQNNRRTAAIRLNDAIHLNFFVESDR